MKTALITGITGQDGAYLAKLLLSKGYRVVGMKRRSSAGNEWRLEGVKKESHFSLVHGDVTDPGSVRRCVSNALMDSRLEHPLEVYNLAAQSHVGDSFKEPHHTTQVTYLGCLNMLEAIRECDHLSNVRFYQASSSEMFGSASSIRYCGDFDWERQDFRSLEEFKDGPYGSYYGYAEQFQDELTPFLPNSPYAVAKLAAHNLVRVYRESYGIHASCGILFNHESVLRPPEFVTQKIAKYAASVKKGTQKFKLELGNLDAKRDWGHAEDYCINLDVPILTTSGWKFYDQVEVGDEVVNFSPAADHLSNDRVKRKFLLPSDGNKVLLRGRGVHLNVTANHRIYYQQKSRASKGGWSDWKATPASEFADMISGLSQRTKYDYRLPHFGEYDRPDLPDISDDRLYLTGTLLAEGHLRNGDRGRGVTVSVSQSYIKNAKTHERIGLCVSGLGLSARQKTRNDGVTEWVFDADSSRRIMEWFDRPDVHVMPRSFYGLSSRQARIVFESLMDADGCWGGMVYTSKRSLLAADFQTLSHLAGYRTTGCRQDKSGMYRVCVVREDRKYTYVTSAEHHNDGELEVWCVETENGTIVTRDGGCVSISGNCRAMWLMLQQDAPDDYVIATGETHSVREFLVAAMGLAGVCADEVMNYVHISPDLFRPCEVPYLRGDPSKARERLGWEKEKSFSTLVNEMVFANA